MTDPDVTIVMCTHNRAGMLREALESLVRQETDDLFRYDVLVVDNASTDDTAAVVEAIRAAAGVPVRRVEEPRPGQVFARNRGLEEARGEWIANFDDDQVAEPCWLKELMAVARETGCRCAGGSLYLRFLEPCDRKLEPTVRRLLGESVGWGRSRPYTRKHGPGSGNQLLHRSIFEELGTYDESYQLRGYDTDLYRRIRSAKIESWFTPRAVAYHMTPRSRLEERYLRETALHNGWSFARRDGAEWGRVASGAVAMARMGQTLLLHVPRWLWTRMDGDPERLLAARCRLWRAEGYVRCVLYALAPSLFRQRRFFARHEFRAERRAPARVSPETGLPPADPVSD